MVQKLTDAEKRAVDFQQSSMRDYLSAIDKLMKGDEADPPEEDYEDEGENITIEFGQGQAIPEGTTVVYSDFQASPPNYKEIIGKKILALELMSGYYVEAGARVLIFESKTVTDLTASIKHVNVEWQIAPITDDLFNDLFRYGIYKLVGIGIVISVGEFAKPYTVVVQDDVRDEFGMLIPF